MDNKKSNNKVNNDNMIEIKVPEDSAIINESEEDVDTLEKETDGIMPEETETEEESNETKWYDEVKAKLNLTDAEETEVDENTIEYYVEDVADVIDTLSKDLDINLHNDFDGTSISADCNDITITVSISDPIKITLSKETGAESTEEDSESNPEETEESEEVEETEEPEEVEESVSETTDNSDDMYEEMSFADYVQNLEYKSPTTFKIKK